MLENISTENKGCNTNKTKKKNKTNTSADKL